MRQGLLTGLVAIATLACTTGAIPTTTPGPSATPGPTQTAGAQPTPARTSPPTAPSVAPPTLTPGATAAVAWTERSDVAPGPDAREDHTWTVDGDGQVAYLFGGRSADGPQADLWAFDLTTDSWTERQPAGDGPAPRFGHTATWVPSVGLVVWSGQGADFFDDIWAYDPAVDAWHELPSLGAVPEARYGSCASLGPDGRLWISHGFTQDDGRFADTRAYDFATGEWSDMTPAGEVPVKRCLHDCFWSGGRLVLYGGQTTGVPALGDIWAFDAAAGQWTQGPTSAAPARQLYALAPAGGEALNALVFGGGALDGSFLGDTLIVSSNSLGVSQDPLPTPDGPAGRSGAAMIRAPGGSFLLFGGQNAGGLLGDLWEYSGYWLP